MITSAKPKSHCGLELSIRNQSSYKNLMSLFETTFESTIVGGGVRILNTVLDTVCILVRMLNSSIRISE